MSIVDNPRNRHLMRCKEIATQHMQDHAMFVTYIHRGAPTKLSTQKPPTPEEIEQILALLRLHPHSSSEKLAKFMAGYQNVPEGLKDVKAALLKINAVKTYQRVKKQPKIGVVVGFRKDDTVYIGWSLCKTKAGDQFHPYYGMREAIKRAIPLANAEDHAKSDVILREEKAEHNPDIGGFPIQFFKPKYPHTVLPFILRAIQRAKKRFKVEASN